LVSKAEEVIRVLRIREEKLMRYEPEYAYV